MQWVIPLNLLANDKKVCFEPIIANKLLVDLKICNQTVVGQDLKIGLLQDDVVLLKKQDDIRLKEINGLKLDKQILTKTTADYKAEYEKSNKSLLDCKESKPSRTTWFLLGSLVTAIVAGTIMAFASK